MLDIQAIGETPWWSEVEMSWLENQVIFAFASPIPLFSNRESDQFGNTEEKPIRGDIINSLGLDKLNGFLKVRGFSLVPFAPEDVAQPGATQQPPPPPPAASVQIGVQQDLRSTVGKYLFPAASGTTVITMFRIAYAGEYYPIQDSRALRGVDVTDPSNTRKVVNFINNNLEVLRQANIPILAAMPNWLGQSAPVCPGHGGPGAPPSPVPVQDVSLVDPGDWPINIPDLMNGPLQQSQGDQVTVFVLDTCYEWNRETVNIATNIANNKLINTIAGQANQVASPHIKFRYQVLPKKLEDDADDLIVAGRDIHGRPYGFFMIEHGLFVAGIIRDIVPHADIECIRVLNDFGGCDTGTVVQALAAIAARMSIDLSTGIAGDLYRKAVVVNLSLVLAPSNEDLPSTWFNDSCCYHADDLERLRYNTELLRHPLHVVIQSLTASGAVVVAAAGNDSNSADTPVRVGPRYPAAFPEVISVGAVNKYDRAALYSNYPQLPLLSNGIATYGGDVPTLTSVSNDTVDALHGVYFTDRYPALEADNPNPYQLVTNDKWAYWSGTSFATPIISSVAVRALQQLAANQPSLPRRYFAAEVQRLITTVDGQREIFGRSLPNQAEFGVSLLKAEQK